MKLTYSFIIFIVSALLVSTTSCLKEEIKDTPNPSLIKNEADVKAVIRGAYAELNDAAAFKYQGMIMFFLGADDIYSDAGSEIGAYASKVFTGANTGAFWNRLHATVADANSLMATLDRLDLDSSFEQQAYGDAYFLRALSYYYLVRLYGGVPIRTEVVDVNSNFYLRRNSIDEVYTQIFSDLKKASEMLPVYAKVKGNDLGRATKGGAQAILSQAYLTYGNQKSLRNQDATAEYQNAVLYADSVINSNQYKLLANYGDLFDITKEAGAYDEVIFGVRFQVDLQARAQPAAGSEFALRFGAPNTDFVSGNGARGNGDGTMRIMHWFADYYRKGDYATGTGTSTVIDYRNEKAFFQKGFNSTNNKYYAVYPNLPATGENTIETPLCSKYIDPNGKDSRNNGNDLFIIRLAEVYLIKAEALNELEGPSTDALAAFNTVRARARGANGVARTVPANLVATGLTKDQFRMKIFDERGLELVGEGQRWFDLVRMRSPLSSTQTMYEYQFLVNLPNASKFAQTLPKYNATTKKYSNANAIYAPALKVKVPQFLLFPVPSSEMTQNPNFGDQNPGW